MNTLSTKNTTGNSKEGTVLADEPMFFQGTAEGESNMLVLYRPVPEPMLLRNHPTKRFADVFELIPLGGNMFGRRLLSTTVVDVAGRN